MAIMAISDAVLISTVTAVIALVGTMFNGIMAYIMARLDKKASAAAIEVRAAAVKVEDVKKTLQDVSIEAASKVEDVKANLENVSIKVADRVADVKSTLKEVSSKAAERVEDVKKTLQDVSTKTVERLDSIQKTGKATHVLVNNNMRIELQKVAELSRWKADQGNNPIFIKEADIADEKLAEHMRQQVILDGLMSGDDARGK